MSASSKHAIGMGIFVSAAPSQGLNLIREWCVMNSFMAGLLVLLFVFAIVGLVFLVQKIIQRLRGIEATQNAQGLGQDFLLPSMVLRKSKRAGEILLEEYAVDCHGRDELTNFNMAQHAMSKLDKDFVPEYWQVQQEQKKGGEKE